MRGRKPKPSALRLIEGNPGKRAVNVGPDAGPVGSPPADLDGLALDKWHEMVRLWRLVVTAADRDQLAEYCRLEARRVDAETHIQESGPVAVTAGGQEYQSVWLQILNKCREDMRKIAIEFGGTPSSRSRVSPVGDQGKDEFAGLIKQL